MEMVGPCVSRRQCDGGKEKNTPSLLRCNERCNVIHSLMLGTTLAQRFPAVPGEHNDSLAATGFSWNRGKLCSAIKSERTEGNLWIRLIRYLFLLID